MKKILFCIFIFDIFQSISGNDVLYPCVDSTWTVYQNETCFKVLPGVKGNFSFARSACARLGAHLPTLKVVSHSLPFLAFVIELVYNEHGLFENVWLGAQYETSRHAYSWLSDNSTMTKGYWKSTCDGRQGPDHACVQMEGRERVSRGELGAWCPEVCSKVNQVVCEKPAGNLENYHPPPEPPRDPLLPCGDPSWASYKDETCFKLLPGVMANFTSAMGACARLGGRLPTVYTPGTSIRYPDDWDQFFFISHLLHVKHKFKVPIWLGSHYEAGQPFYRWMWDNSSINQNIAWGKVPQDWFKPDWCVQLHPPLGDFSASPCRRANLVLCEKDPVYSMAYLQKSLMTMRGKLRRKFQDW